MKKYYYLVALVLFSACGSSEQPKKGELTSETIEWNVVDNKDNFFNKLQIEYVVLSGEVNDKYLSEAMEIIVYNNKYYVRDSKRINVYDENGVYIQTIGNIGRAANEYLKLSDMSILRDTLYVLDGDSDEIVRYDEYGKFINRAALDVTLFSDLTTTAKGLVLYRPVYDEPNDGNIEKYALTEKDYNHKTTGHYLKYDEATPIVGMSMSIIESDSLSFFAKFMIDQVVIINRNTGEKSIIAIDFKDEKMPKNKNESLETIFSEVGGCYYMASTPILYKNWLIGSCTKNQVLSSFAININTQEVFLDNGILNKLPTSTFTYGGYLYRILDQSSKNESFIANSPDFVRSALSEGKNVLLKMWINE